MKSIIIDDEQMARAIIEKLCTNNSNIHLIDQFPSAIDAIKFLNQQSVDLLFLDIHMPVFTGFDLLQTIKNPPKVILTTSDKNFAIEAFEYNCIVDYLVKPITQDRFDKAITKALNFSKLMDQNQQNQDKLVSAQVKDESLNDLYVNIDRRLIKINYNSIKIIEAKGDYILIKTQDKNYTVHSTLKKIEEKLPEHIFLKVHRSYIVNLNKIVDIEDNSVLIDRDVIPVSRSNRPELMNRLNLL